MHIAQVNVANMKFSLEDERMSGFVSMLDEINALADISPGFVWRYQEENGNATELRVFDDPMLLINLSVWKSPSELKQYVYSSGHSKVMRQRKDWFNQFGKPYYALWWVPEHHIPTLDEAKQKLERLQTGGPGPESFQFSKIYQPFSP